MAENPPITARQIQGTWIGLDDTPVHFVNQFIGQVDDQADILISFGVATPPLALGTPQEQAEQLDRLSFIPIKPVARFALSRDRLVEFMQAMQATLDNQELYRAVKEELRRQARERAAEERVRRQAQE
jgi:hypothetical protein